MAGEWIKVRTNLWDDPRIGQLCELTDQGEAAIIGGLYWLWATADEHSSDGLLHGMTTRTIDRKTGVQGLGKALVTIGWLAESEEGVTIIRFDEHNGSSAKARAQGAKRQSKHRGNAGVTDSNDDRNADTVTGALPREDKNKEEIPPIPPKGGEPDPEELEQPKRKTAISLQTYLEDCKRQEQKAIPEGHAVFAYASKVGIPDEFLRLHWLEFRERYTMPDAKRYKAWPTVFHKSVKGNWFRLWRAENDGSFVLSTTGLQAKRSHQEAA